MTNKAFNKWRHQLFLCKDNFGKRLYPYDYVRVSCPSETSAIWCSVILWSPLTGANIFNRPGVLEAIYDKDNDFYSVILNLNRYFTPSENIKDMNEWSDTLQKITSEEYDEWFKETELEYPNLKKYYE